MTALEQFTFIGNGIWRHKEAAMSISLNEDYHRTFRAYRNVRPYYDMVRNGKGNEMRFRSAEAAASYLISTS
jgi:hypothetical protein